MRLYKDETDLQSIVDLLTACEWADQGDNFYSVKGLQLSFAEPGFDPCQNVALWEDAAGNLAGSAELWMPTQPVEAFDGFLWFRVHPDQRWQGIEADILAWAETRLQRAARDLSLNLPIRLLTNCRVEQFKRVAFYEQQGFEYERCFFTMTRSLAEPIAQPELPEGFQIIQMRGAEDAEKWVEMYNQTFIDHWGFHPHTVEERCYWLSASDYCPELDLVAVAPDGTFAAFCYGHIDTEANQQKQQQEGWISSLGTRRGFRRIGLARAMLLAGLQRLQAAGIHTAKLGVDTANPNSAQKLYESVGFRKLYAKLTYVKML
jgi:ribosomal protein S18 acetylase RimI-like enzyme